jgi:hypothetical protein
MAHLDQKLAKDIAALDDLSREALLKKWNAAYGAPPFKGARNTTLIRGLAYHLQCKRLGFLKPSLSRQMLKLGRSGAIMPSGVCDQTGIKAKIKPKPKVKLGSQLVREWNGRTHTVHVTNKGYVLSGVTYRSLSAAAKAITGAHWSGPRFFGVAG